MDSNIRLGGFNNSSSGFVGRPSHGDVRGRFASAATAARSKKPKPGRVPEGAAAVDHPSPMTSTRMLFRV